MRKILTSIFSLIIIAIIACGLYVFELPPFNVGGPFIKETPQTQETQALPEFLSEDRVSRAKSYSEYMNRGKMLEDNGYHALAVAQYEAASNFDPQKTEPIIEIGRIHLREKDPMKAKLAFEQALKISPTDLNINVYLIRSLLADRKITDALGVINSLKEQNQSTKYYAGIIAAYFGNYDNSKSLLQEAATMATSQDITNKAKNFLSAYDEYNFNAGSTTAHLKTLLARSFAQTGEYNVAIPLLFEVLKDKKDYRDAWILLGFSYLNLEKFQDAVDALEEARKLDPQKSETLFYLGLGYYGLNDLERAATSLELAKKNGYQPQVQIDQKLAEIYLQQKKYEQSAQSYENVISLNQENVSYFIKPMWIYLDRLNQPEKAMILAQKAYQANPNQAMSYNLLGWASIYTERYLDADSYLKKAMELDPKLDAVYLNYGLLMEKKDDLNKSIYYYKKAYELGKTGSIGVAAADRYSQVIKEMGPAASGLASTLSI